MKRRALVLTGLLIGMSVSALMQTFVSATAAGIAASLGGTSLYPWIFSAYILASTVAMPLFGKLGETMPSRGLYAIGALLFGAGSFAAALAPGMSFLIAARVLSGIGAGAVVPAAYAIVGKAYKESEFGRVFSLMGVAQIAANVAGPIVGGLFSTLGWRWGFLVSAALVLVAAPCVLLGLPKKESPAVQSPDARNKPDWPGAVLISASLLSLVLGLQLVKEGSTLGGIGLSCAALALSAATYFWEARQRDPILPLAALRTAGMPARLATAFLIGAVSNAALAFVPLALTGEAGSRSFALLPMMVAAGIGTIVAGFVPRAASKTMGTIAWSGVVASFALLAGGILFDADVPFAFFAVPAGFGMGYLWPALLGRSQKGVASGQLASLGGALQISRNAGGSAAVSLLGVLVTTGSGAGTGLALVFSLLVLSACAGIWTHHRAQLAPALRQEA